MNARNYRVHVFLSPINFPPIMGLGESSVFCHTDTPYIINNKVVLTITKKFILLDVNNNKEHEISTAQSIYEIPCTELKTREDVHEFYNDGVLSLNEAYTSAQTQAPALPDMLFPNQPIEIYKREIDCVFDLLRSRN